MADTPKVLGQSLPAAITLTTLYTVPGVTSVVVSTLLCCNQSLTATTIRISVAVAGAADEAKQYLYYDLPLAGKDNFSITEGWTLAATDVIRVYSSNGQVSFNLFGVEIT